MKYKKIVFAILTLSLLTAVLPALAADSLQTDISGQLENLGKGAGYKSAAETGGLPQLVGKIINIFLSILGVLFVVLIVYGGYTWMTSYGNSQKVDKAKEIIIDAIIGIIIIILSYAIANFVVGQLVKTTTK